MADITPAGKPGRLGSSLMRRLSLMGNGRGTDGPHDIKVAEGVNARLYPASNRCEKRAFAGVHHWDSAERSALDAALQESSGQPFVFMDVGANVGLYSLFLHASARNLGRTVKIIAIEPDTINRSRLEFNCLASKAAIDIEAVAIAGQSGKGHLSGGDNNRGEVALSDMDGADSTPVQLETLDEVAARHDLSYIDAMKVDIEGHDYAALEAFFANAPRTLWPKLLIIETGRGKNVPVLDLVLSNDYQLQMRSGINAILTRSSV